MVDYKFKNKKDIDKSIEKFTDSIHVSMSKAIPKKKFNNLRFNKINDDEIVELISKRNKFRKMYQRTGDVFYNKLKNKISKEAKVRLAELTNNRWETKLKSLKPSNNTLWKLWKSFTRKSDNKIPTLHGPNGLVYTNKEKADVLADNFEKVHSLTKDFGNKKISKNVKKRYKKIKDKKVNLGTIKLTSPKEIQNIIKKMRPRKAPGHDGMQNIVLKNLSNKALVQFTNIINACLKLNYFPDTWKIANVLSFKKPGKDSLFPQNYRPISLLPTMSKVMERVILNRILEHESENKILISEQFGFRSNRSTVQQLVRITNEVSNNYNINKSTAMILLDIEKAFDTVWHKGLIYKLYKYKFPTYIIKTVQNDLKHRFFRTVVCNQESELRNVSAGVPQGSILGPVLFIYFITALDRGRD